VYSDVTASEAVIVRLTGCPSRCTWCDAPFAFYAGTWLTAKVVLERVAALSATDVYVTGGEPLAQSTTNALLRRLAERGHRVLLETSCIPDISGVDPRVRRIVDVKTPSSGEVRRNRPGNFAQLRSSDAVKFVITGRDDFDWSLDCTRKHDLVDRCRILLAPCRSRLSADELSAWLAASGTAARLHDSVAPVDRG